MDAGTAGRATKDCYIAGIATKGANIFLNPLECLNLIENGVVAGGLMG